MHPLTILAGSAHPELANDVARHMGRDLGPTKLARFADGEINIQIGVNIRGHHVVILQPTPPPAEHWIELIFLIDAARRASASEITVVMPYMGYARQDRKDAPRTPISAARMPRLLIGSGANRLLTIDLHASQTQGVIDEPFDNFYFSGVLLHALERRNWNRTVLVSPDAGGMSRCTAIAKKIGCPVAMFQKRRERPNESEAMGVVGNVRRYDAVLLDDMVDTGGSLVKAAEALLAVGAHSVSACCTHPVLSAKSLSRLARAPLQELVVGNTIEISPEKRTKIGKKLRVANCAPMLADAIRRIHGGESLSVLFDESLAELTSK